MLTIRRYPSLPPIFRDSEASISDETTNLQRTRSLRIVHPAIEPDLGGTRDLRVEVLIPPSTLTYDPGKCTCRTDCLVKEWLGMTFVNLSTDSLPYHISVWHFPCDSESIPAVRVRTNNRRTLPLNDDYALSEPCRRLKRRSSASTIKLAFRRNPCLGDPVSFQENPRQRANTAGPFAIPFSR